MDKSALLTCFYMQIHASMVYIASSSSSNSGVAKPEIWDVIVVCDSCSIVAWSLHFNPHLHVHLDPQSLLGLTTVVTAFPDRNQVWPFICNTVTSHLLYT